MPILDSPCHGCDKRHPACHDHCEEFVIFRKTLDDRNASIKSEKQKYYKRRKNYIKAQHYYNKAY